MNNKKIWQKMRRKLGTCVNIQTNTDNDKSFKQFN